MRTRRNKQNENESLDKIKQIRDDNEKVLFSLLNALEQKEKVKKHLINLNHLFFEAEVSQIMEGTVSKEIEQNYIKEENEINKINFVYLEKKLSENSNAKEVYKKKLNEGNGFYEDEEHERVVKISKSSNNLKRLSRKNNNDNNSNNKNSTDDSTKYQSSSSNNITTKEKVQKKRTEKINKEIIKKDENCLKLRLRYNRANRIVIDRYIQRDNSMNPFDDSINKAIACYNTFGKDYSYYIEDKNNFGHYLDKYIKGYLGDFFLFSDSDDETNFEVDIKKFQNDHKTFLKNKRNHS